MDFNQTRKLFELHKPNYVVHLAALVGGLYKNQSDNLQFLRVNWKISDNVLAACHETSVKKVVSCLSTCILPEAIEYPADESKVHAGPPLWSNHGYAYAKRMVDILNHGNLGIGIIIDYSLL